MYIYNTVGPAIKIMCSIMASISLIWMDLSGYSSGLEVFYVGLFGVDYRNNTLTRSS